MSIDIPTHEDRGELEIAGLSPESVKFDEKSFTLLLNIDQGAVDCESLQARAEQDGFAPKKELHLTVLGFKIGGEIKKLLKKSPEKLAVLKDLINGTDWRFTVGSQRWWIEKDYKSIDLKTKVENIEHRESYIQTVNIPCLVDFYHKLNELFKQDIPFTAPPAHVTLFTKGDAIGVNTLSELQGMNPRAI